MNTKEPLLFMLRCCRNAILCLPLAFLSQPLTATSQTSLFDPTFAIGDGSSSPVSAIHVQSDGTILVGATLGCSEFEECQEHLFRLHPNGEIDESFPSGTDGSVSHLVPQPDGKILAIGYFNYLQGIERSGLGRLLTNGIVDPDFDSGDLFTTDDALFALAVQPDGKILVATLDGFSPGSLKSRLFRLEPNGSLDGSFVQTNVFNDFWVYALMVRTNGTILVGGGFSSVNGVPCPGIAVLDSSGKHDITYNFDLRNDTTVFEFQTLADQSILAAGVFVVNQNSVVITNTMMKLSPGLAWNTNFLTAQFESGSAQTPAHVRSVLLQPDGKMVAGGYFHKVGGYWRRHIVRLLSDGSVDPCFDPGLGLVEDFNGVYKIVRQPDGRLIVGGAFRSVDGVKQFNLTRLLSGNECDITRTYILAGDDSLPPYVSHQVFGTSSPGGTNVLQGSTNLVDWNDLFSTTEPFLSWELYENTWDKPDTQFFRIKKEY